MAVAWVVAWVVGVAAARDATWAVSVAVAGAEAGAGIELLNYFNKLQTFLILSGVSLGGLGLGWLIGATLQSMGVELPSR
ncbi:hypothetical protein H6G89_24475 [Oscillatoria sp. FACHB-1407]|uniref:hypothetical protein n=1 Tax=Oscillatoria sp. FACHB-1407 TaxID=2692847 RepID=UPI00168670F4|nr:hypothetical protein [Oscillatoria sp. FACHB-1407]MBD2464162.1 hypothetical protein [Oscillatoria sp. FACHB-1407]